jgi:hypothetical protein
MTSGAFQGESRPQGNGLQDDAHGAAQLQIHDWFLLMLHNTAIHFMDARHAIGHRSRRRIRSRSWVVN